MHPLASSGSDVQGNEEVAVVLAAQVEVVDAVVTGAGVLDAHGSDFWGYNERCRQHYLMAVFRAGSKVSSVAATVRRGCSPG